MHYTGQRRDETGLLYYHARYYDPALGRFLSADTIVPEVGALAVTPSDSTAAELFDNGGKMSGTANPQELNRYSYANNNPIRYNDPSGHCPFCLAAAGGAVIGGGWSYGSQVWSNYRSGSGWSSFSRNISWRQVGAGAAWGAAGGALGWGAGAVARRAVGYAAPRASAWISRVARAGCSFSADTPVTTAEGQVPIAEVEIGDLVLAYNEALGTTGSYTVTDVLVHADPIITYLTLGGEEIEATPEHPFYTEEHGWVPAGELWVGAQVRQAGGTYGVVQSVLLVQQPQMMYNLSVAQAHTFFVGDGQWLVHNSCGGTYGALVRSGTKDSHHIIQHAAVRHLPGYSKWKAPAIRLPGPSTRVGSPHYRATQVQNQRGGGTYAAERRIAYKAIRRAGISRAEARSAIYRADNYFRSIGVHPHTRTRIPGNRR
jgi:hypothetical protein